MYRYAIFYAPPADSALWRAGTRWLGRDPESGTVFGPPHLEDLPVLLADTRNVVSTHAEERSAVDSSHAPLIGGYTMGAWEKITASARRYGFHATLKAPFRLAPGVDEGVLMTRVREFSRDCASFRLPALQLDALGGFLALIPVEPSADLHALAAACVDQFDVFRAPLNAQELARRRAATLTATQQSNLERYGYPYVKEEFRFHMTLTDWLRPELRDGMAAALRPMFESALRQPCEVDGIALFAQAEPDGDFILRQRFAFGG